MNNDNSNEATELLKAGVLGAECSTGMAVAAGVVGIGLLPAIGIALAGVSCGMLLYGMFNNSGESNDNTDDYSWMGAS